MDLAMKNVSCIKEPGSLLHESGEFFCRLFGVSVSFGFLGIRLSALGADRHLRLNMF